MERSLPVELRFRHIDHQDGPDFVFHVDWDSERDYVVRPGILMDDLVLWRIDFFGTELNRLARVRGLKRFDLGDGWFYHVQEDSMYHAGVDGYRSPGGKLCPIFKLQGPCRK